MYQYFTFNIRMLLYILLGACLIFASQKNIAALPEIVVEDFAPLDDDSKVVAELNEIYEKQSFTVESDKILVYEPSVAAGTRIAKHDRPVLQPLQKIDSLTGAPVQSSNPLMTLSGNGKLHIKEFLITHFAGTTKQPLISTGDESILRLSSVTLST
jgi:hypothetical protein